MSSIIVFEWLVIAMIVSIVVLFTLYIKIRKRLNRRIEILEDYVLDNSNMSERLYFNAMYRSYVHKDGTLSKEESVMAKGFVLLNPQFFLLRYIDRNNKIVSEMAMRTWNSFNENQKKLDEKWRNVVDLHYYWKASGETIRVEFHHGKENDSCRIWDMEDDVVFRLDFHLDEISHDGKKNDPYVSK